MMKDEDASVILARVTGALGPELLELILGMTESVVPQLKDWPPERVFQYVRCRLRFTQSELANKAGLTQSQVSRIESGADCQISTWARAYAAMGFELRLLPASAMSDGELEKRAEEGRPQGHWLRQRSRPRRHWGDGRMITLPGGRPPKVTPLLSTSADLSAR